jgi:hypothetical protein
MLLIGGLIALGLIAELLDSILPGKEGGTGTRNNCPAGLCAPDRDHVLTDHFGADTNTSTGRRSQRVRHVEEQPEFIPAGKMIPEWWKVNAREAYREQQLAEKVGKIVEVKTEELKAEAKTSFWKLDR